MVDQYNNDEPAVQALEAFQARNYKKCLNHLAELEIIVGPHRTVALNKSLAHVFSSNMKNLDHYRKCLCQQLGQTWPSVNTNELRTHADALPFYNYAILLYHKKYYSQANTVLERVYLLLKTEKGELVESHLSKLVALLLLDVYLCRRLPEKAIALAEQVANEFLPTSDLMDMFNRLLFRANLMLKKAIQPLNNVASMEWLLLKAHQQHLAGDSKGALATLAQHIKFTESRKKEGKLEEIWAPINNNIGVIQLSMRKCHLSARYIQQAVKEHFRGADPLLKDRLFVSPDRPMYVYNLGIALLYADRPDDAFECLVEAARHYPNNPRLWARLADCCINHYNKKHSEKLTIKKIGSGLHTKLSVSKVVPDKYLVSGESFAIPTLSLEFAALCLRNALTLLPSNDIPKDPDSTLYQIPPSAPIKWNRLRHFRSCTLLLNTFVMLRLSDPISALKNATLLLSQPEDCLLASQKALGHIYMAEALIYLDRLPEALDHLNPTMIHEMAAHLRAGIQDSVGIAIWLNGAICQILRGDLTTAKNILLQLNSIHALHLQLYIEICTGNIDNCHTIIRKLKLFPS